MTVLKVEEMSCNHCVQRIGGVLEAAGITHSISLEDKTVAIEGCENCAAKAIEELGDIGFTASPLK